MDNVRNSSQSYVSQYQTGYQMILHQPTTSKGNSLACSDQVCQSPNDFIAMDVNSADEVRQTMKAVHAGKIPPYSEQGDFSGFCKVLNNTEPKIEADSNHLRKENTTGAPPKCKKRGRPPKAGPSKRTSDVARVFAMDDRGSALGQWREALKRAI